MSALSCGCDPDHVNRDGSVGWTCEGHRASEPERRGAPFGYPKEDVCRGCGAHLGWVLSPGGEAAALGVCGDCETEEER